MFLSICEIQSPNSLPGSAAVPLVVDVDGTLVLSDYLHESIIRIAATKPLLVGLLPYWLSRGKAYFKDRIARLIPMAPDLPTRNSVTDLIKQAKREGRAVYLASASDARYIEPLARKLGNIDGVFATEASTNLAGSAKADALVKAFGDQGFDYIGDSDVDFAVWSKARTVLAVSHGQRFSRRLMTAFPKAVIVETERLRPKAYLAALRPHQWAKNMLVFLPLVVGHTFLVPADLLAACVAFVCFSLAASSAYVINDLLDITSDRRHPTKFRRPFAAGLVPVKHGFYMSILLALSASLLAALMLPPEAATVLAFYFSVTLTYSLLLKRKVIIDVIALAGLYTIRVLGGATAIGAPDSNWLLMFCLFLFLCLAICKRYTELMERELAGAPPPAGRAYRFIDRSALLIFGAVSGLMSVLVVALYMSSQQVTALYTSPDLLWLICVIQLYWIARVILVSNRGELHEDPVVFALRDRTSWLCALGVFLVIVAAM